MNKSTDIRVIKTQKALLSALEVLIKDKALSAITITELCSAAKINRNTFYYHYNNVYDLLAEYRTIVMAELSEVLDVNSTRSKHTILDICRILRRHPSYMSIIISPNCELGYFDDIFGIAAEKSRIFLDKKKEMSSVNDHLLITYCNAGCVAVLHEWISEGMNEPPETIADIISQASRKGPISIMFPGE